MLACFYCCAVKVAKERLKSLAVGLKKTGAPNLPTYDFGVRTIGAAGDMHIVSHAPECGLALFYHYSSFSDPGNFISN